MRLNIVRLIVTLALLTGWSPLAADAQPLAKVARIGYLSIAGDVQLYFTEVLREGLRAFGYIEGQNLVIESRSAEGKLERLPALAAELVQLNLDVIVTFPSLVTQAVKHATTTVPIVMVSAGDPVGTGLVASLARPGGNITGLSSLATDLSGKRLELLKEALPPSPGWPCSGMPPIEP